MAAKAMIRAGFAACLLGCCWWNVAAAGRFDKFPHETATDPTRDYLPAKYYERVALEDLRHKDYTGALDAYTRAAYWGNKVAQYDLGEIYLHGLGKIRADPARGVAWLGVADEAHNPDYDRALVGAYKALKPSERKRAEAIWAGLQATYADKLTLARATRSFEDAYHSGRAGSASTEGDPNTYTFSIGGYDPAEDILDTAELISDLNELGLRNGATSLAAYWPARKKEFAQFVVAQFGHVEIGPIEQISPAKKKPAH
ncbi:MAG: sel1 repeat family protein [Rhodanobacteraceae bacterium]|nr:MAG: sel1 repeat family protein [Rhodanobacteraceae bacterium]